MSRSSFRAIAASVAAAAMLTLSACGVETKSSAPSGVRADEGAQTPDPGPVDGGGGGGGGVIEVPDDFQGTGGVVFLNRAAEATSQVKTQHLEMRMEMDGGMMPMSIVTTGQIDLESGRMKMEMDMGDIFGGMLDELDPEDLEGMEGMPDFSDMSITMITADGTTYMRSALFSMFTGSDKTWVSMPADELDDDSTLGQQQDPNAFLEFLKNSNAEVVEEGREEVRGVETTHISTVLDLREIMKDAPDSEKAEMEEALEGMPEGFEKLPFDVWIDDDGYIRRFEMKMDMSDVDDTQGMMGTMVISMDLFDFNEPVDIAIPDPSDVEAIDPSMLDGTF